MNFLSTNSRATVRLRMVTLVALPLLTLSVACGGDSDGADKKDTAIADVPDAPKAGDAKDDGEPSAPATGKSAYYDAQLKYVQCMRAKAGFKDFPDPKLSGHLDWDKIDEIGAGGDIKGGKGSACTDELMAAMDAEPERDQQKAYESMLAHAKCMRDNGVSKFTNPTMSGGNALPGGDPNPASPSLDINSPTYKQAREACKSKLLDGLDGMQ
jgi:hypothetical protein